MQAIRKEKEEPLSHIQVTLVPAKIKKSSKIKYIDTREAGDIFNRGKPYGVEDSIKPLMNVLSFLTVPELVNVQLVIYCLNSIYYILYRFARTGENLRLINVCGHH